MTNQYGLGDSEAPRFRLFRCAHGCFHLEWKEFGIVNMSLRDLHALYRRLIRLCARMVSEQSEVVAQNIQIECNQGISISLSEIEALALLSRIGAFVHGGVVRAMPSRYAV